VKEKTIVRKKKGMRENIEEKVRERERKEKRI